MSVSAHEKLLRQMACAVSGRRPVTLHHCHGGSMRDLGPEFPARGKSQKSCPYFQIPLHADYHVWRYGIDSGMGVLTWEERFGRQLDMLREVNKLLPYDIFELALEWHQSRNKIMPRRL